MKAEESKRKIYVICPISENKDDILESKFSLLLKNYLIELRLNIDKRQKELPYALNTYPFVVTAKSNSVVQEDPIEVLSKPNGIYAVKNDIPILSFEEATCQVIVGLEQENCIRAYVKNGDTPEELEMCVHDKSNEKSQFYALLFAKKIAVDCSRFKDKNNDVISLNEVNQRMLTEYLSKRDSIEELDGNVYEAFSKIPDDCRLSINIISREKAPTFKDFAAETLANLPPQDNSNSQTQQTDITQGIFITKA